MILFSCIYCTGWPKRKRLYTGRTANRWYWCLNFQKPSGCLYACWILFRLPILKRPERKENVSQAKVLDLKAAPSCKQILLASFSHKDSVVHRKQVDCAISRDYLDLLAFIVTPLLDFNLLRCPIWPLRESIVVSVVCVKHVKVAASGKAKCNDCCCDDLLHFRVFPFFLKTSSIKFQMSSFILRLTFTGSSVKPNCLMQCPRSSPREAMLPEW